MLTGEGALPDRREPGRRILCARAARRRRRALSCGPVARSAVHAPSRGIARGGLLLRRELELAHQRHQRLARVVVRRALAAAVRAAAEQVRVRHEVVTHAGRLARAAAHGAIALGARARNGGRVRRGGGELVDESHRAGHRRRDPSRTALRVRELQAAVEPAVHRVHAHLTRVVPQHKGALSQPLQHRERVVRPAARPLGCELARAEVVHGCGCVHQPRLQRAPVHLPVLGRRPALTLPLPTSLDLRPRRSRAGAALFAPIARPAIGGDHAAEHKVAAV
mmetsp:Transcript_31269/g.71858  ORF Transcript_31269/g.71858 Transcript_31269/m.71858 type:complete len:279 (-) Transcript_31269:2366-3202(-)